MFNIGDKVFYYDHNRKSYKQGEVCSVRFDVPCCTEIKGSEHIHEVVYDVKDNSSNEIQTGFLPHGLRRYEDGIHI